MNKSKKFVFGVIFILFLFITFHFVIWQFTKKIYPKDYIVGDLARMSYKFDSITQRNTIDTLSKKHIHFNNYNGEEVDIITIGDSFSNGGAKDPNRYYQDYISSIYNLRVLNILKFPQTENYVDTILILLESGFLEKSKVKYVILESVQRNIYENIGFNKANVTNNFKYDNIVSDIVNNKDIYNLKDNYHENLTFINNLNYNLLAYNSKFFINGYGKQKKYYIEKLNKEFFTSKSKDELIFFYDDIRFLSFETIENLNKLNKKLNLLANKLKEKDIKLIFMPAVDKYNLYRSYIISNEYSESIFFEYLEELNKDYYFVNTKKILLEQLENDVKDLYYSDDTHWSNKASEVIIRNKVFRNLFENN